MSASPIRILVAATFLAAALLPAAPPPAEAAPPPGFTDTLVADVSGGPMDVQWTPDGRMLVITKAGVLLVFQGGTPTTALNLASVLCTNGERGLAGLAVHPNFASNRFIYLYYTYNGGSTACAESETTGPVNRLSRFVLGDNNLATGEQVLFQSPPMYRDHHTGGDPKFGKDGFLYVTVGDSGAQSLGWPQNTSKLAGKLVRIADDGSIPPGNPFTGAGTARCNATGSVPAGSPADTKCQEIFSYGLRNPFRMAMDPNAAGTRFFINDVGQHTWEDISEGPVTGGNYGWQLREGPCQQDSDTACGSAVGMVDPVHWYHHGVDGAAATGGAFVPASAGWPAEYAGKYLYADYVFGQIFRMDPSGTRCLTCLPPTSGWTGTLFGDFPDVVSMRFGPDGALYLVTRFGGEIRKIAFTGGGNRLPTAVAAATPTSGPVPLTVQFSGSGSTDPDGDTLTYAWDFDGNGTTDATGVTASHTYNAAGDFDATLTVDDGHGGTNTDSIHINPGNTAPVPVIDTPTAGTELAVGDPFTLQGSATDADDGTLPSSALTWEVVRHHATHTHPFLEPTSGNGIPLTFPEPEDIDAAQDSYLEVRLTATDSGGLSHTVSMDLMPKKVDLTFQTNPGGLAVSVGGTTVTGPTTIQSWQGYNVPVNAPDQTSTDGRSWAFSSWSDGGARAHTISTPASPATHTATFTEITAQQQTFTAVADTYVDASRPTRTNGTRSTFRVDGSPILNSYLRFNVQGATDFSSAKLRLHLDSSANPGLSVRPVANNTWSETALNFNNAPPMGAIAATTPTGTSGTWIEVDVTPLVTQNGLVSFALTRTSSSAVSISSRETTFDPELVVGVGAPPPPPPPPATGYTISRVGTTSTYQATSASNTFTGTLKSVVESAVAQLNGTGGGLITFTAGDFDLGATWFEFDAISNITFNGAGMAATTLRNNSSAATDTEPFDVVVGTNLVVRDMTVRAGGPFRSTSDALDFDAGNNVLIERVQVTESRGRGIVFDGKGAGWDANGNTVRDCVITGVPADGIELLASSSNTIEGCTITNVAGHGIQLTKSSTSASQPNKKSSNNIVRNNTIDQAGQDGINVNSGDANQLTGNTITNSSDDTSGRDGIRIGSSDSITCNDNAVNGNTATDNQATKTQSYGLNISSSLCSRTVVGVTTPNNFAGNRIAPIRDLGTNTIYPPPATDTQPPTAPTNLQATTLGPDRISLSWQAATDNVGVTGYDVYRGATLAGSVGGATLTFEDGGLAPSTTYTYTVKARDAANNVSPASNGATATTAPALPPGTFTFTPTADSYVDSGQPASNFGLATTLRFDGSPTLTSFLRFDVGGLADPVTRVTLRFLPSSSNSTGCTVRDVANDTWGETTITFNNAPPIGVTAAACGALTAGTWREVDLTSSGLVTGNGPASLALVAGNSTATTLSSRQGSAPPQLVVETGSAPPSDTTPPTAPGSLQASAPSGCQVNLSWTASSDNVGVTNYRIVRNGGTPILVSASTLSFQDTTVSPSTAYTYVVDALDAAGNNSPDATASITTPSTACSSSLTPIADSWVDSSQPTANFGTSTQVRCDGSPVLNAYLKFNVQSPGPIGAVKLRIFANSNHSSGFSVRPVSDTTWGETTIAFNNAPAAGAVAASSGPLTAGTWVEVDITSLVSGNGLLSVSLTTTSGTAMSLASRESANSPQLVITGP